MPKTAVGWAGYVLLLFVLMQAGTLRAEPTHCYTLGRHALMIASDIAIGVPLEENTSPQSPEYWEALKQKVKVAWYATPEGEHRAELAAQKVLEACLYHYGANRGKFEKMASSEKIKPELRHEMCRNALDAHFGVAFHAFNGMPREELHARIEGRQDIPEKERGRVHDLVDELFDSGMNPQEWLDGHVKACVYGDAT